MLGVQVQFPDDWKVDAEGAEKIAKVLAGIPAEKKAAAASGSSGKWYLKLTDAQIAECKKDPQLFVVCCPPRSARQHGGTLTAVGTDTAPRSALQRSHCRGHYHCCEH